MLDDNQKQTPRFEEDEVFSSAPPQRQESARVKRDDNVVDVDACERMMSQLSEDQRIVAEADDRNILLIAPAGTGKTRTLTARVAAALSRGIKPSELLLSTYTNAAARENIERLEPVLRIPAADLWIGTLHSLGLRILRANAKLLGLPEKNHGILDETQQLQIVTEKMRELRHPAADGPDENMVAKRILGFIHDAKNRMMSPADALEAYDARQLRWAAGIGEADLDVYREYTSFKQMYGLIDYDDMLYMPTKLIEENEEVRQIWMSKFKMVMVDEYQDLAQAQIRFLRNLIGEETQFFAAADDDQCIYGWRGSDLKATTQFSRYWRDAAIYTLADNYRTPKSIFRAAGAVITNNADRYPKKIKTRDDERALVRVLEAPDPTTEKQRILDTILDAHRNMSIRLEDMAILCRVNRTCNEIATFLSSAGITVNLHESLPLHTQPVSALLAWIQAAQGIDNPLVLDRIARFPEPLLDEGKLREINQRVNARNARGDAERMGPVAYLADMRARGKIPAGSGPERILDRIELVRKLIAEHPGTPFATVGHELGIAALANQSERAEDQLYGQFVKMVDALASDEMDIPSILASITSLDMNSGKPGINILTMHGAKGLEYEVVFAPGWEEGEFPSRSRHGDDDIAEERRLAYVTITRAKRMFVASYSSQRRGQTKPSRFIREMNLDG